MISKTYDAAIAEACDALRNYYYLAGENMAAYEPIKRGVVMGLAIALCADPHEIESDLDNYRG